MHTEFPFCIMQDLLSASQARVIGNVRYGIHAIKADGELLPGFHAPRCAGWPANGTADRHARNPSHGQDGHHHVVASGVAGRGGAGE